jgi:hypothetical protein
VNLLLLSSKNETGKDDRYYRNNPELVFKDYPGARVFKSENSTGGDPGKTQAVPFTYKGRIFDPGIKKGLGWKTKAVSENGEPSGMDRLAEANPLYIGRDQLGFKKYHDDFGYRQFQIGGMVLAAQATRFMLSKQMRES